MPTNIALALVVVGLIVGFAAKAFILGALIAGAGAVPAGYASWLGLQSEKQTKLVGGMLLVFGALGAAAILIVAKILNWLT
jgi:hypothetical protein